MTAAGPVKFVVASEATVGASSSVSSLVPSSTRPRSGRGRCGPSDAPPRRRRTRGQPILVTSSRSVSTLATESPRSSSAAACRLALLLPARSAELSRRPARPRRIAREISSATADHDNGLRHAGDVVHVPALVRQLAVGGERGRQARGAGRGRSSSTPVGIDTAPDGGPLADPRVHGTEDLGPHPAVFRQVDAAAGGGDDLVQLVEKQGPAPPSRAAGRAPASSRPSETRGAPVRPARSASAPRGTTPARAELSRSSTRRTTSSAPNGTTNWYWVNPRGPYRAFQPPTPSRGWKKVEIFCSSPVRARGARRYQASLKAATVSGFSEDTGGVTGTASSCARARSRAGSSTQLGGEVRDAGVIAHRDHRPSEMTASSEAVDPCHRVPVIAVGLRSCVGHAGLRGRRPARCSRASGTSRSARAGSWRR